MSFRIEVLPFIAASVVLGILVAMICRLCRVKWKRVWIPGLAVAAILSLYMLYFFRDPDRISPEDPAIVVSAADGKIANVVEIKRDKFESLCRSAGLNDEKMAKLGRLLETDTVRVSIFLSLIDVHVNRAPIGGTSDFLGYYRSKRHFTFKEKSSEENQHNAICMKNEQTICLINQIVGPVARRVVYWPDKNNSVVLKKGARIGMMKFGSRLDMYFPKDDIDITVKAGDRVAAGVSQIGTLRKVK